MNTNRLAGEKSPYLLQHAHNPVDWYPWGEEAFERARTGDKPIFLSIGYSTCHWCHVMERESFENEPIAALLNRDFVPVKVDREERPDVDRIYMTFVQATTGSGGWPMSVFLTPDLEPFFGGTYFPPDDRYGRPGFVSVLARVAEAWRTERDRLIESASQIVEELRGQTGGGGNKGVLDDAIADSCFFSLRRSFDTRNGGFGGAPKFPRPVAHDFLLAYYARKENPEALEMVVKTLAAMARGGMRDQLGGGFHRYSVDDHWFVPHFEKMLYDQAQLAISYLQAFQITREPWMAEVVRDTFEYVLRDLRDEGGAFYSAEDADSAPDPAHPEEKSEGAFYLWTKSELEEVLGVSDGDRFCAWYGVEPGGNVREDPHGEFTARNILYQAEEPEAGAAAMRARLLGARSRRPRPHLDDKILTAWNGLMISALALGGAVLEEPRYIDAARAAADFILKRLYDGESGTLLRRYRDGEASIPGFLDDYAFFVRALLDLYEADFNPEHLEKAIGLTARMRELFEDRAAGAFFSTTAGADDLILRVKDEYDGAEPSGNSVAVWNLLRLAAITGSEELGRAAERAFAVLAPQVAAAPVTSPELLAAREWSIAPRRQIVLAGSKDSAAMQALLREVHKRFLPGRVLLLADAADGGRLAPLVKWLTDMREIDGRPAAYVCEDYTCRLPVNAPDALAELLK